MDQIKEALQTLFSLAKSLIEKGDPKGQKLMQSLEEISNIFSDKGTAPTTPPPQAPRPEAPRPIGQPQAGQGRMMRPMLG